MLKGFNAFRNVDDSVIKSVEDKGGLKTSLGIHNSLLQLANTEGYLGSTLAGAGVGAGIGAAQGLFSYDGSFFGGAFHGALTGAAGGAGLRFAAKTYAHGSVANGYAKEVDGAFQNSWTNGAFKTKDDKVMGAFQTSAFKAGW